MEITCNACGKKFQTNGKLDKSLTNLAPGKRLRVKCGQCGEPIVLTGDMMDEEVISLGDSPRRKKVSKRKVKPPEPPDTSWLEDGVFDEEEIVSDIPQALVLMPEGEGQGKVINALTGLGYRAETAKNTGEALEKMQFLNYSSIVMHSKFNGKGLTKNRFHLHMSMMGMSRRRYIFYALVGPEFKTFYNLQALVNSANLTVNAKDIPHFGLILRKAIPEYEELFGSFMEELKVQGKESG